MSDLRPERMGPNRKRGTTERTSEKKIAALAVNSKLPRPGGRAWEDDEVAARVKAVRELRRMTPTVVKKLKAMLDGPLAPIELATLARVIFDRGGVPPVTQMELVGDQIPQTLVISYAQRQAMLAEAGAEDASESEQPGTNGTNGTAH